MATENVPVKALAHRREQPTPAATSARLSALIEAARRLSEDIEEETTPDGFNLATALQCVLDRAHDLARELCGDAESTANGAAA